MYVDIRVSIKLVKGKNNLWQHPELGPVPEVQGVVERFARPQVPELLAHVRNCAPALGRWRGG